MCPEQKATASDFFSESYLGQIKNTDIIKTQLQSAELTFSLDVRLSNVHHE